MTSKISYFNIKMNNKVKISSILNQSNNLVDIFNYHVQNKPLKKLFYKKKKAVGSLKIIKRDL